MLIENVRVLPVPLTVTALPLWSTTVSTILDAVNPVPGVIVAVIVRANGALISKRELVVVQLHIHIRIWKGSPTATCECDSITIILNKNQIVPIDISIDKVVRIHSDIDVSIRTIQSEVASTNQIRTNSNPDLGITGTISSCMSLCLLRPVVSVVRCGSRRIGVASRTDGP